MEVRNNIKEVPFEHYLELYKDLDPSEVESRTGFAFEDGAFKLSVFGDEYKVAWPNFDVSSSNNEAFLLSDLKNKTFILRLILEFNRTLGSGTFKTFREMSWGEVYIEPFTGRCLKRAAFTFGTDLEKFKAASLKLGSTKIDHADAAFQFEVMDDYFVQFLVWEGDDEFPPNSQILYSNNFEASFAAEDRVVIAEMLITLIKKTMKEC